MGEAEGFPAMPEAGGEMPGGGGLAGYCQGGRAPESEEFYKPWG